MPNKKIVYFCNSFFTTPIMKKILPIVVLLFCVTATFGQKVSPTRAYNLYYEKDFVKAKECIDACTQDEKYSTKASTWLYKANIEYQIATAEISAKQQDSSVIIAHPTAPEDAYMAFKKAEELNKNVEATDMLAPYEALPKLYPILFIEGVNELIANKFEKANQVLKLAAESYEMQKPEYPLQGELYYYYAYTFEMLKDNANAQKYYQKAIDDGSENMNVYIRLIESYKTNNQKSDVLQLITKAKAKDANNAHILVAEADYYYWIGENKKGRELLDKLPASVFQVPEAVVNAANLYIKDESYVEAETLLKKAYDRTPNNYVVVYNLGVCCDNIGNAKYLEANKLDISGNKKEAQTLKNEADGYLSRSATYFEKALQQEPNDKTLMHKLKEIYLRLLQNDKADAMDKRINQ